MTPKEKAEELYTHMFECVINPELTQLEMETMAISCVLIAVGNIILANPHSNPFNTDVYSTMDYWIEVKKEIENL